MRFRRWLMIFVVCLSVMAGVLMPAAGEETEAGVWMDVLSVGKADAILLGVDGHTALIDTGYAVSLGRILAGMERRGVTELDAVIVTHLDSDHVGGLTRLAESDIPVGKWYASGAYNKAKSESKHPVVKAAGSRGDKVTFLWAGNEIELGSAVLKVLAPFDTDEEEENDNSLVMMLESAEGKILLAGDMEYPEEQQLLASGKDLTCDVLKVANHGDNDTNSTLFAKEASPKLAVISTSSEEKPGTPDPGILRMYRNLGTEVAVTEECTGGIHVTLAGGVVTVTREDAPAGDGNIRLVSAVPGDDLITLENTGEGDTDLSGWYIASDRGQGMFVFPEDTVIKAGGRLVVGSASGATGYDVLWNEKKIVNKKKTETFTLYDRWGNKISERNNGI